MLVLSRRIGQQIRIGESVVVTLLKVERNKARIGIEAPAGVPVFRQELLDFARARPTVAANSATHGPKPVARDVRPASFSGSRFQPARTLWDGVRV